MTFFPQLLRTLTRSNAALNTSAKCLRSLTVLITLTEAGIPKITDIHLFLERRNLRLYTSVVFWIRQSLIPISDTTLNIADGRRLGSAVYEKEEIIFRDDPPRYSTNRKMYIKLKDIKSRFDRWFWFDF